MFVGNTFQVLSKLFDFYAYYTVWVEGYFCWVLFLL